MKIFFLISCFILFSLAADAQNSRYIIVLKDKNGTTGTIANPAAFLSTRAIERRTRYRISVDSTDLPVSAAYLTTISSVPNVVILNKSNWLNQVCIKTSDPNALATIQAFPFVQRFSSVAPRLSVPENVLRPKREQVFPLSSSANKVAATTANTLNYGNTLKQIHIHNGEYLHNRGLTGRGVTMAVLDAGFFGYKTNPAFDSVRLQNRILAEWDFVANEQSVVEDDTHGMHCFSIIAANRPGSIIGSAPHAAFYLFRTEDAGSEYPIEEQNWIAAAERADSAGADMISSSLGYSDFDNAAYNHTYAQRNGNTAMITIAADLAAKKGMIVMNSAGNSGAETNDGKYISCPADGDSVVAVGAVDVNGNIAAFSSWGPNGAGKRKPNIVSVGQGTVIAGTDGNAASGNGTSYSNPNIAGLIACFWQAFPEFSNMEIIDAVQRSADRYANPDNRFGFGLPDFKKAFSMLIAKSFKGRVTANNCSALLTWTGKDDQAMQYLIEKRMGNDPSYRTVSVVSGKSPAFTANTYAFTDSLDNITSTSVHYRIKQVLPQDTTLVLLDTSIAVTQSCNNAQGITIGPNPFLNTINVRVNTMQAMPAVSISLYNMKGQRLYYYEGGNSNGPFTHNISVSHLPHGVYVVTIRSKRKIIYTRKVEAL